MGGTSKASREKKADVERRRHSEPVSTVVTLAVPDLGHTDAGDRADALARERRREYLTEEASPRRDGRIGGCVGFT